MNIKLKNLALTLLAATFISATPTFASAKTTHTLKQLTLANRKLISTKIKPQISSENVIHLARVNVKIYTYSNAPKDVKKNYEVKCKFNNIRPLDTDMIMVKSDSSIDNSLATASDTLSPGQVDYVDVYYFRDSGSIETAAHQRNTDIYYIGYATVHRDYVGYGHITSGDAVYTAQSLLVNDKYYLAIDGLFGPDTNYFVKLFQGNKNLSQDGIVGPQTWYSLLGMLA